MAHSISEFDMFPEDQDKDKFLDLLSECKEKYHCKVYGFCLITNHYHFLLDTNGFDVSDFMRCLNQRYVKFNTYIENLKGLAKIRLYFYAKLTAAICDNCH